MADANYGSVGLLIPGIGENNGTDIYDYSRYGRDTTVQADAKISTAQSKFYGSSIAPGASGYLDVDNHDGLLLLETTSIWTIRCWVYLNSTAARNGICATRSNFNGFVLRVNAGGAIQVFNTGGSTRTTTATLSATTWHHIEIVRNGGTVYMFIDGVLDGSVAWANGNNETTPQFVVGIEDTGGTNPLNGYLSDFEVTIGVARHTSAFTVPTQLCPGITGAAKIGSSEAYQVRSQSVAYPSTHSPAATPAGSGSYTLYTADVKQTLICHHDDPTGTVTATPEAAVVDPGATQNFSGVSGDGGGGEPATGNFNAITLSAI